MYFKRFAAFALAAASFGLTSCDKDDDNGNSYTGEHPYVMSLAVQGSDGNFTYYTLPVEDVMSGEISAVGQGIEQPGYFDFTQVENTIYSIGGLGDVSVKAITLNANGKLAETGTSSFDNSIADIVEADENTLVAVEIPGSPADGDMVKLHTIDKNSVSVTGTQQHLVTDLTNLAQPSYSGMRVSGNKLYLSYYLTDPATYKTDFTDTAYVAVYSYPELQLQEVIKDTRTGPVGGFNVKSGMIVDEKGDIYTLSHSNPANGFSQTTTTAGIMKINSGEAAFDQDYFFDLDAETGGKNPSHMKYLGNGKVFAEINQDATSAQARWSDAPLKSAIIDIYNQTVTYIDGMPEHSGPGRRLPVLNDNGKVYHTIPVGDDIFVYEIDPSAATATQGAKVEASFVAGFFRL